MAQYPDEIYTPRARENRSGVTYDPDKKTVIFAEDLKKSDDEVVAIETELGTNPKGAYATVKAWLEALVSAISGKANDPHGNEAHDPVMIPKNILTTKGDLAVAVGPVGHWKMNDDAADKVVADDSGLGNNGVAARNTNLMSVAGKINTALNFNSAEMDAINMGDVDAVEGIDEITIAFWLKIAPDIGTRELITKHKYNNVDASWAIQLNTDNGRLCWSVKNSRYRYIEDKAGICDNNWHHIIATYSKIAEEMKLYVDNVLKTGGAGAGTFITIPNTAQDLRIGVGGSGAYLTGSIDDVRIYNKALTPDEIAKIYNEGNGTEDMLPVVRRLPVGTNGQRLQADSATPEGMKWVTP